MNSNILKSLAIFMGIILLVALLTFSFVKGSGKKTGEITKADVEQIVADYIQKNPKAILDSVIKYQQESAMDDEKKAQGNVKNKLSEIENNPDSPVAGNPKGDVVVVEFFDYSCGYCKKVLPEFTKLIDGDKNIKAVFKEFPILGPNSLLASQAALAVYKISPEKYFDFHKKLMGGHASGQEGIDAIAKDLGIDVAAMQAKMKSPEVQKIIESDKKLAMDIGIRGTPAFIINGQLIPGAADYNTMKSMVEQARNSKKDGGNGETKAEKPAEDQPKE